MGEAVQNLIAEATRIDSFGSIVVRGLIWFVVAVIIIISADSVDPDQVGSNLKANLGFFLMFIILSGGLIYLLFGFSQQA